MPGISGPDLTGGRRGLRRLIVWGSFVAVALVVATNIAVPGDLGPGLLRLSGLLLAIAIGAGPILRRARPWDLWALVPIGMACLVLATFLGGTSARIGRIYVTELLYVAGYLTLCSWLWRLCLSLMRRATLSILLDSAAATAGMFLALWTLMGAVGLQDSASALVWALYPVLDVIALALVVHLSFRISRKALAWRWVAGGVVLQLALDLSFFAAGVLARDWPPAQYLAMNLFTWWCLAVAATHPTIAHVARREPAGRGVDRVRLRPVLLVLAVVPALGSLVFPVNSARDGLTRSVVVSVLLAFLFARLLLTMAALSRAEASSRHRASHDPLTGLLNRGGLFEELGRRLDRDATTGSATAVLFLDCDDFKHVNDTWGHPAGDSLLRAIADGLPRHLGSDDLVARHGGDEFVIVTSVPDLAAAEAVADRVTDFFAWPLPVLPGRTHRLTPSIGVTLAAPGETRSPVILLERADTALYEAKGQGRNRYVVYDEDLEQRAGYRAVISDMLRTAIAEDHLTIGLQPILGGPGYGDLVGWEALARWTDPTIGSIPPDVFVALAEEHGLIDDLGESVLRMACAQLAILRRHRPEWHDAIISVNVSATQLTQPCFADIVADAVAAAGIPPEAVWLEVTENLLVDTTPVVLDTIERLHASGVVLALDDFGAGMSSFASLLHLPIGCLKLDKSLVDRLRDAPEAPDQLRALLELLSSLHIERVVAEGVETAQQAAALQRVGCPLVQGWLYGKAQSLETLTGVRRGATTAV